MPASTKRFTAEIDAALYDGFIPAAKQNGQSQRSVLEQALTFYLRNVAPSQRAVRPEVMQAFEQSTTANYSSVSRSSPSREAAKECSPQPALSLPKGRKPWVEMRNKNKPRRGEREATTRPPSDESQKDFHSHPL